MSRTVLIAGGTRGIGLEIGKRFAADGDRVVLTHRWGSVSEDELIAEFKAVGAKPPEVIEADIASDEDTDRLLEMLDAPIDVFVPNVCVAGRGTGAFHARTLRQSLDRSAWPVLKYVDAIRTRFGAAPTHIVATSSDGPDHFYPGYDYVAASKALLESLCFQLQVELPESRVNVLRARQVDTSSYQEMFSEEARERIAQFAEFDLNAAEVAAAVYRLCHPDLDGLRGQVLVVDRGATRLDNLMNVAPRLLGSEPDLGASSPTGRGPGVLCVSHGVRPSSVDFGVAMKTIELTEIEDFPAKEIPDVVIAAIDWNTVTHDQCADVAGSLMALLQKATEDGSVPRYGVQIDSGNGVGIELMRTLGRYWNGWSAGSDCRINFVHGRGKPAWSAARALVSGDLDGVNGHVLDVRE